MSYEPRRPTGTVENYTKPFLWMAGIVLFLALFALWAAYGYLASLATALVVRIGIAVLPTED